MITLRCIVDNTVLRGSPLWGEHGVAFWIETPDGSLLFDTGQSGDVLVHNAKMMGIDFRNCDAVALSHAHYDHTGGLKRFISLCQSGIPLYASPNLFRERYSVKNGQARLIGLRLPQTEIARQMHLHLSAKPLEIFPGIWTTGEIGERLDFEGRSAQHYIQVGDTWLPDPYQDDLSLVLHTSLGLVVVCGCCHAGLLNTLAHIQRFFSQPIRAVVGGAHLATVGPEILSHVVAELRDHCEGHVLDLYLNHCSGERALITLAQAFGEKTSPCPAGTVLMFD